MMFVPMRRRGERDCGVWPKYEELRRRLLREINDEEDNLRLYRLTEPREQHVETYGLSRTVFYDEPLIV